MKTTFLVLFSIFFVYAVVSQSGAYEFHWEIDETPEGQESATVVEPVQVTLLDQPMEVVSHSASIRLLQVYSVHLGPEWESGYAHRLFLTFESIPQQKNPLYEDPTLQPSIWKLSNSHIQNDIEIEYSGDTKIVTIAADAFTYATPLLAEIEGVRGRYFSKRLHRAVVRYITDSGADRNAIKRILQERYAISINVPDYIELTKYTTSEHAGRFSTFKDEELMALVSMFEEFPQGMLKTPGLKYLVRRLDGTPHPLYLTAPAVAWPSAGYIEFMEAAFKGGSPDYMHRLILHEKAHFLWAHVFAEQLKQDWIELGGWYENADDEDGWSTTKQTEFVSAYAHARNPNEDMAESISFYIIRPDKLRSRSPAKYEFIQNRIMHGTRYISQIREDLTFEVYNLYPDYVYPGRIVRVDIQVDGEPEEDKMITVEIEIHRENELDSARGIRIRIFSEKGTFFDIWLSPINAQGQRISAGHVFRGSAILTRYAPNGYWGPDSVTLSDVSGNQRHESAQTDFGWKLYINNPLADCQLPAYVEESMRLSLSQGIEEDRTFHIITARWQIVEDIGMRSVYVDVNDESRGTYSRNAKNWRNPQVAAGRGGYNHETGEATVELIIPDYYQKGNYLVHYISMVDFAGNRSGVYFSNFDGGLWETDIKLDELPASIYVPTINPDNAPVALDLNNITIKAEPTKPEDPNGETIVDITFRVKDNISGYKKADLRLRDPLGNIHLFTHFHSEHYKIYFHGDPKVYETYHKQIILPVGSIPGTWGLAEMVVFDKAHNILRADFTEIVRFKVDDGTVYATYDVNEDGVINILDLVIVASFNASNERADVNGDGTVNILDLVEVASHLGEEDIAAPAVNNPTADQIQSWITQAMQVDDGSPAFRRGIPALQNLLLNMRPETTALLPNYPNPFNPETWIPYHLANASDVQITIYDTRGSIVRTLVLGHRAAGYYTDKNRAAYWDGRNSVGERIASGVYFYQLQVDTISQLRKMLILK